MRLLATDLDGTLIPHGGAVSPRTIRMLHACREAGVRVVFVTGRPVRWMHQVIDATGFTGVAICGNGAVVVDLPDGRIEITHTLPVPDAARAAQCLRTEIPGVAFATETLAGFREESNYPAPESWAAYRGTVTAARVEDLLVDDPGVLKLLATSLDTDSDRLLDVARTHLGGVVSACHSTPVHLAGGMHLGILEMAAPGVTKASTLAELAASWGIAAEDVVAFGDMPNDVEMLTWAGRSWAMADAHPEALGAADDVAPPAQEDGVARVVEGLLAGVR